MAASPYNAYFVKVDIFFCLNPIANPSDQCQYVRCSGLPAIDYKICVQFRDLSTPKGHAFEPQLVNNRSRGILGTRILENASCTGFVRWLESAMQPSLQKIAVD
jgi:hypothetical protein